MATLIGHCPRLETMTLGRPLVLYAAVETVHLQRKTPKCTQSSPRSESTGVHRQEKPPSLELACPNPQEVVDEA